MTTAAIVCIALGLVINMLAVAGALRFPDVFTRAHAIGMSDTLGVLLIILGLMLHIGPRLLTLKLLVLLLFFFMINPTVIHAVLKSAMLAGIKPWKPGQPRK